MLPECQHENYRQGHLHSYPVWDRIPDLLCQIKPVLETCSLLSPTPLSCNQDAGSLDKQVEVSSSWWKDETTSPPPSLIITLRCRVIFPLISLRHVISLMMERHLWYCKTPVWKELPTKANGGWNHPLYGPSCGSFDKLLECKASHSINQRGFSWRPSAECRMALKLMKERNRERIGRRVLFLSFNKFDIY